MPLSIPETSNVAVHVPSALHIGELVIPEGVPSASSTTTVTTPSPTVQVPEIT